MISIKPDIDAEYRFWSHVNLLTESGCWQWLREPDNGYGRFWINGRSTLAHRHVLELLEPERLGSSENVDHLCRNRACVRPDHLDVVTIAENVLRGKGITAQNARATECPQGHEYDRDNTYVTPSGSRNCRQCRREAVRRWRASKKGSNL